MSSNTVSVSNASLAATFTAKSIGLGCAAALAVLFVFVTDIRRYTSTAFLTEPVSDMKFHRGGRTQVEGKRFDLSFTRRVKGGRVKDRKSQVEPFAQTLVSLMLIEAICEQSGCNGDDEGEAQDPKNWDIVFLDQETRLSLLIKVDNVVRNLNGKVDFAVWYEGDKNGMGTNLVAVEAKRQAYPMPVLQEYVKPNPLTHGRKTLADPSSNYPLAHKLTAQAEVWGMATDGNYFMIGFFICCGLYILLYSLVVVEWFCKAPRVPPGRAGGSHLGRADDRARSLPGRHGGHQGPGRAERGNEPRPLINGIQWPASQAPVVASPPAYDTDLGAALPAVIRRLIMVGTATDGHDLLFLRVDDNGTTYLNKELNWARSETIWGFITHVVEQARVL
ncbi:hypothetical protein Asppvi_000178 [Aspergillus pseudoviridinutans]|uniref:Uncharacterized protein n=1 Tax=Aspergillus pseudoviridinutans TaxID=1517512 RepID=A0A9P3B4H8_9EURO|nr:uncharacterized protein Asppvi_000178 [Aspergillus pseudoviridinutans]GIJ81678.1 hypothetical protein Asppvi_000178 [Aspergillus pseudoviridinutans]